MKKTLAGCAKEYFEIVRAMILVLEPDGKIEYVNEKLCCSLGYCREEIEGKPWVHFISNGQRVNEKKKFKNILAERKGPDKRENYVVCKNGELLLVEWQDSLLKDKKGNILGVFSSGEDITDKAILRRRLLEQKKQHRKELMNAILEAGETERRKIAYELHDGINQTLLVSKMLLENEMNKGRQQGIQKVIDQLQSVINEIRSLSYRINQDLSDRSLITAIKELIQQVNTTGKIKIISKLSGARFLNNLSNEISLNLYRIIQEAFSNILKHSGAKEAKIIFQGSKFSVDLEIYDNGKGLGKKTDNTSGVGLRTIHARAQAIGGKAYIESMHKGGTFLSVHVSLKSCDEA